MTCIAAHLIMRALAFPLATAGTAGAFGFPLDINLLARRFIVLATSAAFATGR